HLGGETPREEILAYRASLDAFTNDELAHLVEQAGLEIPQFNRRRAMRALEIAHSNQDLENQESPYEPLIICLDD
ncbi:tRNA dimethylallyltransferase, partial [Staphylococcus aureus]